MATITNPQMNQMTGFPKQSNKALILAVVMSVFFVLSLAFGIWAFIGMQENQSNLDKKIEAASEVAVQQAESAKEVEFTEREKNPFKTYTGSATYGSLSFDYPKSWSVYLEQSTSSTLLDFYAHPNFIPGLDDTNFAFRAQIIDSPYEDELKKYDASAKTGSVTVSAFRPENLPDELGAVIAGEIERDVQGTVVLLPQRDKTFKLFTESSDYQNDFLKIIKSVTFIP